MKNLENYGVLEMNAKEIRETDGGSPWYVIVTAVLAIGSAVDYVAGEIVEGWNNPQ